MADVKIGDPLKLYGVAVRDDMKTSGTTARVELVWARSVEEAVGTIVLRDLHVDAKLRREVHGVKEVEQARGQVILVAGDYIGWP